GRGGCAGCSLLRMWPSRSTETTTSVSSMGLADSDFGSSRGIPSWSMGAATMEMMSSTSMTSTSGVTLISARGGRRRPLAEPTTRAATASAPSPLQAVQEVGDELVDAHVDEAEPVGKVVVGDDSGDGGGQAGGGGPQGLRDPRRVGGQRRRARGADPQEGLHDPPHRAEEADEGGDAGRGGQEPQAARQPAPLHRGALAEQAVQGVQVVSARGARRRWVQADLAE